MSRRTPVGGSNTRRPRASSPRKPRSEADRDPDAVRYEDVDWETVEPVTIDLDPAVVETIRARRRLKPITLRVGLEQIAEARRVAEETGTRYQTVLRRWLAEGASRARAERAKVKAKAGKRAS